MKWNYASLKLVASNARLDARHRRRGARPIFDYLEDRALLASQVVVNFDDLHGTGTVPDGYGGINWEGNWTYTDANQSPDIAHSGKTAIYIIKQPGPTNYGRVGSLSFASPVIFNGAWFSGRSALFGGDGHNMVTLNFYYKGNLVGYSKTLFPTATPQYLASNYFGLIDTVTVYTLTDDEIVNPLVMDDVTYTPSAPPPSPSVSFTDFSWDVSADGTSENAGHRGLDFSYNVNGTIPLGVTIPIAFYWAAGTDPSTIISPTYSVGQDLPDTTLIQTTPGNHGFQTGDEFQLGNDPARWGTPPADAHYVMAIIDPNDTLGEQNDDDRVKTEALPTSTAQIFQNPIVPGYAGTVTEAAFDPLNADGSSMPLSEAEVYLGIDHFNWIQQITSLPPLWEPITVTNLDTSRYSLGLHLGKPSGLAYVNGDLYYYNFDGTVDYSTKISFEPVSLGLYDPIVQPNTSGPAYYRGIIIDSKVAFVILGQSDIYNYYLDEYASTGSPLNVIKYTVDSALNFTDIPYVSAELSPYPSGTFMYFSTRLVGVNYDLNTYQDYSILNPQFKLNFNWKSNTVIDPLSGGVSAARNDTPIPPSEYVSGGVSAASDSAVPEPIPSIKLEPVGNQSVILNNVIFLSIRAQTAVAGLDRTYSLGIAPVGSSIDPNSGAFSWIPQMLGIYPVKVIATDQLGESTSTTFNITVLPEPKPPTVTAGSDGMGTAGSAFVRTGSFQDATGTAPFTATVNYGDGSLVQSLSLNADNSFELLHVYSSAGIYTVTVSIADANGLTGMGQFSVSVAQPVSATPAKPTPTLPIVAIGPYAYTNTWTAFTGVGSIQDASSTGPFTVTVDYGDGSPLQLLTEDSDDEFELSHVYSSAGNYPVSVVVADANGLTGSGQSAVSVTPPISGFGSVADAFITSLYREVLNRSPEYSGLRFWASKFASHIKERTIVKGFFQSAERRALTQAHLAPKITPKHALADANRAALRSKEKT